MEAKAYIKNVKISPKKLRFLIDAVKKMDPYKALDHLYYTPTKSAKILYKAVKSAVDNAKNISKDIENLKFKKLLIEEGRKLKRFRAGGRGTAKPILRRFSHIQVILEADQQVKSSELSSAPDTTASPRKLGSRTRKGDVAKDA